MALPPLTYAELLGDKIARHKSMSWLVNTGWSGGAYGEGQRIKLAPPAPLFAPSSAAPAERPNQPHPVFGVQVPLTCPGVPTEILDPRQTWKNPVAYDQTAQKLAGMFDRNFQENAPDAPSEITAAGPKV